MRRFFLFAIAAASVAVISCTDVVSPGIDQAEMKVMTFSASSEAAENQTKTTTNQDLQVLWQEGDAISIFNADGTSLNNKFTLVNGAGSTQAYFNGSAPASSKYFALYPYTDAASLSSDGSGSSISFHWDGSAQKAVKGSFDPAATIMAGSTTETGIQFKNLCAFVKVTMDFACSKIELYSEGQSLASSDVSVSFGQSDEIGLTNVGGGDPSTTAAIVAAAGDTIKPGTYLISVLPTTLYGFEIKVTTPQGAVLTRSTEKWGILEPGHILNLGSFSSSDFTDATGFIGSGTAEDPYLIGNRNQFDLLSHNLSAGLAYKFITKHYLQTADIDFGGDVANLGTTTFEGVYDGGGHKLTNICLKGMETTINDAPYYIAALFPMVDEARIKNLTIECSGIEYRTDKVNAVYGGFVGIAYSSSDKCVMIDNCTFDVAASASINLSAGYQSIMYGGIIGFNHANLVCTRCTNSFPVTIYANVNRKDSSFEYSFGGIVGKIYRKDNGDCYCNFDQVRNNAEMAVYYSPYNCYAGGIVGYVEEGWPSTEDLTIRLVNAVNKGYIGASSYNGGGDGFAGGLIGKHDSDGGDYGKPLIFNCLNCGTVQSGGDYGYAGGLMGWCYNNDTRVCASVNVGNIYVDDAGAHYCRYGALCGTADGEYYNCAFTSGKITYDRDISDSHVNNAYSIDIQDVTRHLEANISRI